MKGPLLNKLKIGRTLLLIFFLSIPFGTVAQQVHRESENNAGDEIKLGLALSGGGARGFVNIGVIKALHEEGIYPDIVIGSSMGGIISALYGSGLNDDDLILTYALMVFAESKYYDVKAKPEEKEKIFKEMFEDELKYSLDSKPNRNKIVNYMIKQSSLPQNLKEGLELINL